MTAILATSTRATAHAPGSSTSSAATRRLLTCGAAAGPLWVAVSFAQAATRADYAITRAPLSMLSTGDLGWLQIANFVVAGILVVLGAAGLRRAMPDGRRPARVATVQGLALVAAGALVMDPLDPSGAPPAAMSWHGTGHLLAGMVCFTALTVLCVLMARRFRRAGRTAPALFSALAAAGVVVGNVWGMGGGAAGSVVITASTVTAMLWSSRVHAGLRQA